MIFRRSIYAIVFVIAILVEEATVTGKVQVTGMGTCVAFIYSLQCILVSSRCKLISLHTLIWHLKRCQAEPLSGIYTWGLEGEYSQWEPRAAPVLDGTHSATLRNSESYVNSQLSRVTKTNKPVFQMTKSKFPGFRQP